MGKNNWKVKYEKIETEIYFTDGELMRLTYETIDDCMLYIKELAKVRYVDSVRIELF